MEAKRLSTNTCSDYSDDEISFGPRSRSITPSLSQSATPLRPLVEEEHIDVHSPKATPNTGMLLDIKKLNLTPKSEIRRSLENTGVESPPCQRMIGFEEVGESTEKELIAHQAGTFAEDFDQMFNREVEAVKTSHNISITDLCDSITKLDLDCSLEKRGSLSKNSSPYVPGEVRTEIHNLGNLLIAEANRNTSTVFISQEEEEELLGGSPHRHEEDPFDGNISQFDELLDQDLEVLRSKSPKPVPEDIDMSEIAKYFENKYNNSFDQVTVEPTVNEAVPSTEVMLHDLENIQLDSFVPVDTVTSTLDTVESGVYEGVGESSFLYKSLDIPQNEDSFVVLPNPESGEERLSGTYFERVASQALQAASEAASSQIMSPEQVSPPSSDESVIVIPEPPTERPYDEVSDTDLSAYLVENRSAEKTEVVALSDYEDVSETDLSEYLSQHENSDSPFETKPEKEADGVVQEAEEGPVKNPLVDVESRSLAGNNDKIAGSSLSELNTSHKCKDNPEVNEPTTETQSGGELLVAEEEHEEVMFNKEISHGTQPLLNSEQSPIADEMVTLSVECDSFIQAPANVEEESSNPTHQLRLNPEQVPIPEQDKEAEQCDISHGSISLSVEPVYVDEQYVTYPGESVSKECIDVLVEEPSGIEENSARMVEIPGAAQEHCSNEEITGETEMAPVAVEEKHAFVTEDLESIDETLGFMEEQPFSIAEESAGIKEGSCAVEDDCYYSILEEPMTIEDQSVLKKEELVKSIEEKCLPSEEEPIGIAKEPASVEVDLTRIEVEPADTEVEPVSVEVETVSIEVEPASVEPEPASVEAEPVSVEVEPADIEVELAGVEVEPTSVEAEPVSVEVEPAIVEAELTSGEAEPADDEVETAGVEVKPADVEVEPVGVEFQPAGIEVEPASVEAEPTSIEAEPVRVEVEPAIVEAEPTSIEAEPVSVEIEPASVEVEPVSVEVEPASVEVEPVSVEAEPVSLEVESVSLEVEPAGVEVEPASVEAESADVEVETAGVEVKPADVEVEPVSLEVEPAGVEVEPVNVELESASVEVDLADVELESADVEVETANVEVETAGVISTQENLGDSTEEPVSTCPEEDLMNPGEDVVSASAPEECTTGPHCISEEISNHFVLSAESSELSEETSTAQLETVSNLSRVDEQDELGGVDEASTTTEEDLIITRPDFLEVEDENDRIAPLRSRDSTSSVKSRDSLGLLPPSYLANIDNDDLFISQVNSPSVLFGEKEKSYLKRVLKAPSPMYQGQQIAMEPSKCGRGNVTTPVSCKPKPFRADQKKTPIKAVHSTTLARSRARPPTPTRSTSKAPRPSTLPCMAPQREELPGEKPTFAAFRAKVGSPVSKTPASPVSKSASVGDIKQPWIPPSPRPHMRAPVSPRSRPMSPFGTPKKSQSYEGSGRIMTPQRDQPMTPTRPTQTKARSTYKPPPVISTPPRVAVSQNKTCSTPPRCKADYTSSNTASAGTLLVENDENAAPSAAQRKPPTPRAKTGAVTMATPRNKHTVTKAATPKVKAATTKTPALNRCLSKPNKPSSESTESAKKRLASKPKIGGAVHPKVAGSVPPKVGGAVSSKINNGLAGRADLRKVADKSKLGGTRAVTMATPGTRAVTMATPGTRAVTMATPGTRAVTMATPGTRAVTMATPGTRAVTMATPGTRRSVLGSLENKAAKQDETSNKSKSSTSSTGTSRVSSVIKPVSSVATKGTATKGTATKGTATKGTVTKGTVTKGTATKGIVPGAKPAAKSGIPSRSRIPAPRTRLPTKLPTRSNK